MKKVDETVNLTTGTTGFIENTGGFMLHFLAQRGIDAQGFSMHEKAWEKSLLANFPVYRREYLRKPLPPLNMPGTEMPDLDRLIWIVGKSPEEAAFVADLYRRKSPDLLVFLPPGESFRRDDFPGHVLEDVELPSVMGDSRFLLISPMAPGTTMAFTPSLSGSIHCKFPFTLAILLSIHSSMMSLPLTIVTLFSAGFQLTLPPIA
jgi:hypothetical protein